MRGSRKFVPLSPNFLFFVDRDAPERAHDRTTRKLKGDSVRHLYTVSPA